MGVLSVVSLSEAPAAILAAAEASTFHLSSRPCGTPGSDDDHRAEATGDSDCRLFSVELPTGRVVPIEALDRLSIITMYGASARGDLLHVQLCERGEQGLTYLLASIDRASGAVLHRVPVRSTFESGLGPSHPGT